MSEKKEQNKGKESKGVRADVDELDDEELYYKYMEENPDAGKLFLIFNSYFNSAVLGTLLNFLLKFITQFRPYFFLRIF